MATIHTLVLAEDEVDTRVKQPTEPFNDSEVTLNINWNVLNTGFMFFLINVAFHSPSAMSNLIFSMTRCSDLL